ncbi:hypothetical protein MLD38_000248 [Melastoma candidum]|uniref:Uncharacterized protein n=1 Tax=Melastoma candidum TaxID=119954 RepID=A0ACB9S8V2_9MYRT|nr:hypothetical protein MLD38_000248 [Melastoma candidum]
MPWICLGQSRETVADKKLVADHHRASTSISGPCEDVVNRLLGATKVFTLLERENRMAMERTITREENKTLGVSMIALISSERHISWLSDNNVGKKEVGHAITSSCYEDALLAK